MPEQHALLRQGISTHGIRHTNLTWAERNFGYAVACAYADHTDSEPRPLATAEGW